MRRFLPFLLVLFLCLPVTADELETRLLQTAERIDRLYGLAGPGVGCLLYDPCYVLAFGELRPEGSWNGNLLTEADDATLARLAPVAEEMGYRLQRRERGLQVQSLRGLALVSRESKLPGVYPFDPAEGWKGWDQWFRRVGDKMEKSDTPQVGHTLIGLALGYPDTAVSGYLAGLNQPVHHARAVGTHIRGTNYLENGQPNFDMMPEDISKPDVMRTCERWGDFLSRFYGLPQVRKRLGESAFLEARRVRKKRIHWSADEMWLSGQFDSVSVAFENPTGGITRQHELVLRDHIEELEALVFSGAPPYRWLHACQRWAYEDGREIRFGDEHFTRWLFMGAFEHNPERTRLYRAVNRVQPQLIRGILAHQMDSLDWRIKRGNKRFPPVSAFVLLLEHPVFRQDFSKLTPERRQRYLDFLDRHREHRKLRSIINDPLYRSQL